MNPTLLFVTWNQNKINEAWMYLQWFSVKWAWVDVPEIQSTDVFSVARAKLVSAYQQTWQSCFVMDASLVIEWLCNPNSEKKLFPWALIKDVFKWMGDKNITECVKFTWNKKCIWTSVIGYFDGQNEHFFTASCEWTIAESPRWTNWYDWDTIFIPQWETITFAEMLPEEKQIYALTRHLYQQFFEFLQN